MKPVQIKDVGTRGEVLATCVSRKDSCGSLKAARDVVQVKIFKGELSSSVLST